VNNIFFKSPTRKKYCWPILDDNTLIIDNDVATRDFYLFCPQKNLFALNRKLCDLLFLVKKSNVRTSLENNCRQTKTNHVRRIIHFQKRVTSFKRKEGSLAKSAVKATKENWRWCVLCHKEKNSSPRSNLTRSQGWWI
jgi:hypothetical protein